MREQFVTILFLNGGIFNEHDGDEIPLNNDYFFSHKRTRHIPELGNGYEVQGIVRILSKYTYKLSLDDLLDHADYVQTIDPEFIDKVFESLLACIEADNKATRRKITGSCYTPTHLSFMHYVDIAAEKRIMTVMQIYEGRVCPPPVGGNITIIVARFNKTITQRLLDGALAKLRQHNVSEEDIRVVWVPGSYELSFVADHIAKDPDCMAIICLGAVIKGETTHDQHINRFVSMTLGDLANRYGTPIIFGVITCDTIEQANARSGIVESIKDKAISPAPGNKGAEAAETALEMIDLLDELPLYSPPNPLEMISQFLDNQDGDDDDDMDFLPPPRRTKKVVRRGKKKG